jgi:N-acetylneuraminic acid mutarotase
MLFDPLLAALEQELRADFNTALVGLLATARTRLEGALAEVARERAQGLAEVAMQKAELRREIEAMQTHAEQQQGRVELNIGGRRFQTSVRTLRRVPHTFFDAYFSGRYAQDVCLDGSIFVDRDGEHFGHVLEYMRDGVVSVAEAGARPSVSLLRALKREFGYYCIELVAEQPAEPQQLEMAYIMGGNALVGRLSSMEQYDAVSGQWSTAAAIGTARYAFGACVIAGEIYVTGGSDADDALLSSVEKYSPSSNTWSVVAQMPIARYCHVAVAVGSAMYVLGGLSDNSEEIDNLGDFLKFDSTQGTWSAIAPAPGFIFKSAAVAVGTDIYVFGGETEGDEYDDEDSVMKYDTLADAWSTLGPMPHARAEHSASVCNGLVYIVGESDGRELLCFDPASAEWSTLAPTLRGRQNCATFVLGGILYAAGGRSDISSVEFYDVATDTWTTVAHMLEGRSLFGAVTIESAGPAEEQDLFDSLIAKASNLY